jgi:hypothetical protein
MAQLTLTNDDLAAALVGFELERDRLGGRIAEIRQVLNGGRTEATAVPRTAKPRRRRSAAVRRRMALAQRARYAKLKQVSEPMQPVTAKPKRKVSRAARKKMAAAQKARWAKIRASEQPAVAKKGVAKKTA